MEGTICQFTLGKPTEKDNFYCDNHAVVNVWGKAIPQTQILYKALVRLLPCNINVFVMHISGTQNDVADAISHSDSGNWLPLPLPYPTANPIPAWPTASFANTSCNAFIMVLPPQPGTPTNPISQASNTSATCTASRHYQHHH